VDPFADLGLTLRRPTFDDLASVVALYNLNDRLEFGVEETDEAETRDFWNEQDLANDHWLLADTSGAPVGTIEVMQRRGVHIEVWVLVHPDWRRRGIGSRLAAIGERRAVELVARAPTGTRVTLETWVNAQRDAGRAFAAGRGFTVARTFWRMRIDMSDDPPPPPSWPEGISVRTFVPGRDERATWRAAEDAFEDHWGHVPQDFDEWAKRMRGELFDPSLWFLAVDDASGEVAGTSLCSRYLDMGWVSTLAVRRAWRGRGLGEALLRHSFQVFHRDDRRSVALGVDADSLTGATRLYERAGMQPDRVHELWTKVAREGRVLEGS
jgi:mycothiol synthase